MPEVKYPGAQKRLRAGSPMPIQGNGNFVLHTFGAEISEIEFYACTESLPPSTDFRGQGGPLMSASFSQLGTKNGGVFSGKKVYAPDPIMVDEDNI